MDFRGICRFTPYWDIWRFTGLHVLPVYQISRLFIAGLDLRYPGKKSKGCSSSGAAPAAAPANKAMKAKAAAPATKAMKAKAAALAMKAMKA